MQPKSSRKHDPEKAVYPSNNATAFRWLLMAFAIIAGEISKSAD